MPRKIPPPKPRPLPTLAQLLEGAAGALIAAGSYRAPAEAWKHPVRVREVGFTEGPEDQEAQVKACIEAAAMARGWACRWEGDELVLELPDWTPPPLRVVATQPGLFQESTDAVETEAQERQMR